MPGALTPTVLLGASAGPARSVDAIVGSGTSGTSGPGIVAIEDTGLFPAITLDSLTSPWARGLGPESFSQACHSKKPMKANATSKIGRIWSVDTGFSFRRFAALAAIGVSRKLRPRLQAGTDHNRQDAKGDNVLPD